MSENFFQVSKEFFPKEEESKERKQQWCQLGQTMPKSEKNGVPTQYKPKKQP